MGNELVKAPDMQGMQVQKQKQGNLSVFSDSDSFQLAMRMADMLSHSTIVPKHYQGNPANCMIAIEMASRIDTSPMMVMQNLYIVNGTPAWSSQWIIAMINNSHRYKTELKFDLRRVNAGNVYSCYAWAEDFNGNKVVGPTITMEMAKNEGWIAKNGSKWKTMPEVMIRYRAASFFGRLNCPDMIMGIYSQEEVVDAFEEPVDDAVAEAEAVEVVQTRIITQDERQKFMDAISSSFEAKDDKNRAYKQVLAALGITSTANMTTDQLDKALELVKELAEAKEAEDESEPAGGEATEQNN